AVADMDGAEAKEFLNKMSVMYKIDTMVQMRRERDRLKYVYGTNTSLYVPTTSA
ncbi:hypothetical protein SARC_16829, partial [Sphaeroforma arctica JP610]